jgi:type II secretory pathway predicted ATPase ExeA
MYLRHFKFTSKPFAMNPDPKFLYPSAQHAKALTMLEYAMESQAAFCVLTGEIGSGKTTLLRQFIRTLGDRVAVGLISNTHERFQSIHPWALSALGIVPRDTSEVAQYEALTEFFIREYGKGRRTLLIFDEAQNLSIQALEELRLLSNINSEEDVALQVLLVGQPELREKLARPELTQFAQRVAVDFHLQSLSSIEAAAYIRHRLTVAGGSDEIFRPTAIKYIHKQTGGVPRLINQLCDLSLVYAYADGSERIHAVLVAQMLQDRSRGRTSRPSVEGDTATDTATVAPIPPLSDDDGLLRERA